MLTTLWVASQEAKAASIAVVLAEAFPLPVKRLGCVEHGTEYAGMENPAEVQSIAREESSTADHGCARAIDANNKTVTVLFMGFYGNNIKASAEAEMATESAGGVMEAGAAPPLVAIAVLCRLYKLVTSTIVPNAKAVPAEV